MGSIWKPGFKSSPRGLGGYGTAYLRKNLAHPTYPGIKLARQAYLDAKLARATFRCSKLDRAAFWV